MNLQQVEVASDIRKSLYAYRARGRVRFTLFRLQLSVRRKLALRLLSLVKFLLAPILWLRPIQGTPLHHIQNILRHRLTVDIHS